MLAKLNKFFLYFNLFFLQSYLIRFHLGNFPTNLQEILILLNLILFFFVTIFEKNFFTKINNIRNHRIIVLFVLLSAISVLAVPIIDYTFFARYLKFLFFAVVLSFIFLETFQSSEEKKFAIKVAGVGAIIFGLFSVIYNLLGHNVAYDLRLLGPLDAAVYLAYFLAPFFIFFLIESVENKKKIFNVSCAIILLLLILATRSMGTVMGIFIVSIVYLFKKSNISFLANKYVKIAIGLMGIALLVVTFYSKILPAIQTNYSSLNERGEIWQTSISLLKTPKNFLFGVGFGQFQNQYETHVKEVLGRQPLDFIVLQPHNIFLLFLLNYGVLGLLLLMSVIYFCVRDLSYPHNHISSAKNIANFIVLYFLLHGLIDTPFFKNDLLILLILFLEMMVEREKISKTS